jgi:hypothetical protein
MRLQIIPLLCALLLSSTSAASIEPRSNTVAEPIYNVYERAVHKIIDRQKQLRLAILDLDPTIEGAYTKQQIIIEERSKDVVNGYMESKKDILELPRNMYPQGGSNFEKDGHIGHLLDATNIMMDAWMLRRPQVFKAGGKMPILELLKNTRTASEDFSKAMIAKAPAWDLVYGNGDKRFKDYASAVSTKFEKVILEYEILGSSGEKRY